MRVSHFDKAYVFWPIRLRDKFWPRASDWLVATIPLQLGEEVSSPSLASLARPADGFSSLRPISGTSEPLIQGNVDEAVDNFH